MSRDFCKKQIAETRLDGSVYLKIDGSELDLHFFKILIRIPDHERDQKVNKKTWRWKTN